MKYGISYPNQNSEAEIQFALHAKLLERGYDSRLEVIERKNVGTAFGHKKGYRQCRFDCVVFRRKEAICIIEVKKDGKASASRQIAKYSIYGIPLVMLMGMSDMGRCLNEVDSICRL